MRQTSSKPRASRLRCVVERDAHALQSLQRQRAHLRAALADAAGENHRVQPAHRGDIGADVFPHAIAEGLEREQRAVVALVGRLQTSRMSLEMPDKPEQAALLVQQLLALCGGQPLRRVRGRRARPDRGRRSACP